MITPVSTYPVTPDQVRGGIDKLPEALHRHIKYAPDRSYSARYGRGSWWRFEAILPAKLVVRMSPTTFCIPAIGPRVGVIIHCYAGALQGLDCGRKLVFEYPHSGKTETTILADEDGWMIEVVVP